MNLLSCLFTPLSKCKLQVCPWVQPWQSPPKVTATLSQEEGDTKRPVPASPRDLLQKKPSHGLPTWDPETGPCAPIQGNAGAVSLTESDADSYEFFRTFSEQSHFAIYNRSAPLSRATRRHSKPRVPGCRLHDPPVAPEEGSPPPLRGQSLCGLCSHYTDFHRWLVP